MGCREDELETGTVQLGHPCPAERFPATEDSLYGSCTWLLSCLNCHIFVAATMWLIGKDKTRGASEGCPHPLRCQCDRHRAGAEHMPAMLAQERAAVAKPACFACPPYCIRVTKKSIKDLVPSWSQERRSGDSAGWVDRALRSGHRWGCPAVHWPCMAGALPTNSAGCMQHANDM